MNRPFRIAAAIAASFAGFFTAIVVLSLSHVVTPVIAKLMLFALIGLYLGFGILAAVYRLIIKLEGEAGQE